MKQDMTNLIQIDLNKIGEGPIRHPILPPELRARLKALYGTVGKHRSPTPEHWEEGFKRDVRPEREIAVWEDIERAFLAYMRDYPTVDQREVVVSLTRLSVGIPGYSPYRRYWTAAVKPIRVRGDDGEMCDIVFREAAHDGQNRIGGAACS